MEKAKDPGMMHPAMGPIKVSVMGQEDPQQAEKKIGPAILADAAVNLEPGRSGSEHQKTDQGDDENRGKRIKKFPTNVFAVGPFPCDQTMPEITGQGDPKYKIKGGGYQEVAEKPFEQDYREKVPVRKD